MSEDLTDKLPRINGEILTAIKNLDDHVGKIDSRLQSLEQKVDGIEKNVDQKLHDTRPIWHKVVADIGELQTGQQRFEQNQVAMRDQISELNSVVRTVNRDQIVINDVVRRIQLDFHTFDERLQSFIDKRNSQNSQT